MMKRASGSTSRTARVAAIAARTSWRLSMLPAPVIPGFILGQLSGQCFPGESAGVDEVPDALLAVDKEVEESVGQVWQIACRKSVRRIQRGDATRGQPLQNA